MTSYYEEISLDYKKLADLIKQYPRLKTECRFILIPGMDDPCSDGVLPSDQLNAFLGNNEEMDDYLLNNDFDGIKHVEFASNPCRINFFGKQILVSRYNYYKKIKKNCLYLKSDLEQLDQTMLDSKMPEQQMDDLKLTETNEKRGNFVHNCQI